MIGEAAFVAEAMKNDIGIAIVLDQHSPCDLIAIYGSKLNRLQVKTTEKQETGKCRRGYLIQVKNEIYKDDDFDFWCIVILETNSFYIVPKKDIKTPKIRIYPDATRANNAGTDYSAYKNRWDLLKN